MIFWFVELLKAIGAVLLLPFQIVLAFFTMSNKGAFPYISYIVHYRMNRLRVFGLTINVTFENLAPNISLRSYNEKTKEASDVINKKKHMTIRSRITEGLNEAKRYSYVIFQVNKSGIMFLQLRTDCGIYMLNFPLTPLTLNNDYAIEIIKLLRKKGYNKVESLYRKNSYCIESLADDLTTIQANLGNDKKYVTELCMAIYTKIFKTKTVPEVIFG
ncbi:MAG: hypothetical protein EPN88_10980 [Bacteroidetes bacterium]|nr:MAG: hypothetical protein EPN88_10980 [Bacteroidota bacterium]